MAASVTVRTSTPQRETNAILSFYNQRCAATQQQCVVDRSHQMDATLASSRLQWMANRNLRQLRNEKHAGELRENLAPSRRTPLTSVVATQIHHGLDRGLCTLFPHEDILARVLEFEREVREIRVNMVKSGQGDPGRPPYAVGYPPQETGNGSPDPWGPVLPHRFYSVIPDSLIHQGEGEIYRSDACPGDPDSPRRFPVFNTLLSIPFSVLHGAPRLSAIFPTSSFQAQVSRMASEIVELWSWDPIARDFPDNKITAATILVQWPPAVHHASRQSTTFSTSIPTYYARTAQPVPGPTSLPSVNYSFREE
ncbi:hypothetical protein B0H12DRAFT_1073587 [Mycena haematopus]|nr:hypothetical protein B0H12DRAFT_1073587 [Mycena haematopus]